LNPDWVGAIAWLMGRSAAKVPEVNEREKGIVPLNPKSSVPLAKQSRMGRRWSMSESRPIKVSFSFYPTDMTALAARVSQLKKADVKVRSATVLRALIHLTAPREMISHTVRLAGETALGATVPNDDNVSGHPTVDLPKDDVKKLDGVVVHLAKAKIIATRAYVVRAILRAAPSGKTLAPAVRKFLSDFPNKPRGLSKIRLARQAKENS
jgi:hypothetical protein